MNKLILLYFKSKHLLKETSFKDVTSDHEHRYVVKTLDNAESVKLQYRSLAKFTDELSSNVNSNKAITPNWL